MQKLPSSKSEEEATSIPSRLISPTSSKPSSPDWAKMLKRFKSKREELLPKRPKNDTHPLFNS